MSAPTHVHEDNPQSESSEPELQDGDIVKTSYSQLPVPIPSSFLITTPDDARPITFRLIDFAQTPLPEYSDCYAAVLDHVLSPSECATLLSLAESSVPLPPRPAITTRKKSPWRPAMVNYGDGYEALDREYRNGDRIIWDCQEVMDRLWARCASVEPLREALREVTEEDSGRRMGKKKKEKKWLFSRLNERGRFLKYSQGQYFRPHCDGAYSERKGDRVYRTHYTVHLYLNDSVVEAEVAKKEEEEDHADIEDRKLAAPAADLVGGATTFFSPDESRRLDVNPKTGRVLIFQHESLYHSGDDVVQGTKYTMRTDIMYELQK